MTEYQTPDFEALVKLRQQAEAMRAEATRAAFARFGAALSRLWTNLAASLHRPHLNT